ncbi:hypothetical protein [Aquimarina rhabdastrellae]
MKRIYQFMVLLLLGCTSVVAQENNETYLYRFVCQDQSDGNTYVLHHNLETNAAELTPISSEELNSTDGFLQSFILQPIEGRTGIVLIASAKAPNYFLKRAGNPTFAPANVNEPVTFEKLTSEDDIRLYCWELVMQDEEDTEIISIEVGNFRQFGLQTPIDGRTPTVTFFRNTSGERLTRVIDNETVAGRFKYRLQKIKNVF